MHFIIYADVGSPIASSPPYDDTDPHANILKGNTRGTSFAALWQTRRTRRRLASDTAGYSLLSSPLPPIVATQLR